MLGFSQVLKPIKRQDLLEKGENGFNAFRTGTKIHFSEKKYFGVRGTLSPCAFASNARFKRRILHVPNLMQMRENNRFLPFALDSADVKCDV